ncbi:MAG TPA: right-handed parallel beta-helix repeat-containing protein, partial [Candidatus Nanopelagicaceae bacterium]|nr:right-handed parallel beta-helix repeat-containing protein [Candidatus Nanopelagicaceae bacterium]
MTAIRKSKIYILILLMLLLPLISPLFSTILDVNEDKNNLPKSSGFWIMGPLHIDDTGGSGYTWAQAVLLDWCSGNGSLLNPYLLENITIDANWLDNGILIEHSNNKHFTIRNCTVMNSGTQSDANAGIELMYTSNGTIEDNICLNNIKTGIYLQTDCSYNTIQNNYIYNSSIHGIRIYQSAHNIVLDNTILEGASSDSFGIYIDHNSVFNTIMNNTITTHRYGIQASTGSHNNTIVNNNLNAIIMTGILINADCNNNTIKMNNINGSSYGVVIGGNANGSLIYGNILSNNSVLNGADYGYYSRWDNGTLGNYWDDYGGSDLDDDGIGDAPYDIPGSANSQDNYPIWDDGFDGSKIHIDDTGLNSFDWEWASKRTSWCTGSGTYDDPYTIEDIAIDAGTVGSPIFIESSSVYFVIRNCNLTNSQATGVDAGIKFEDVYNGKIVENNITDNYVGIKLIQSDNNSISSNYLYDNTGQGIVLSQSEYNVIEGNIANNSN